MISALFFDEQYEIALIIADIRSPTSQLDATENVLPSSPNANTPRTDVMADSPRSRLDEEDSHRPNTIIRFRFSLPYSHALDTLYHALLLYPSQFSGVHTDGLHGNTEYATTLWHEFKERLEREWKCMVAVLASLLGYAQMCREDVVFEANGNCSVVLSIWTSTDVSRNPVAGALGLACMMCAVMALLLCVVLPFHLNNVEGRKAELQWICVGAYFTYGRSSEFTNGVHPQDAFQGRRCLLYNVLLLLAAPIIWLIGSVKMYWPVTVE